ncbi:MAG: Cyanovirin-N [Benniella sp.]|nr:MAG: Cyanovirin-N [Benniella sp.]
MGFQQTSKNVKIVDGHILSASCQDRDGNWRDSSIDLDQIIGNEDGSFTWGGEYFSQSAQGIQLKEEYGDLAIVGSLQQRDGNWTDDQSISLSERIENQNGELVFI